MQTAGQLPEAKRKQVETPRCRNNRMLILITLRRERLVAHSGGQGCGSGSAPPRATARDRARPRATAPKCGRESVDRGVRLLKYRSRGTLRRRPVGKGVNPPGAASRGDAGRRASRKLAAGSAEERGVMEYFSSIALHRLRNTTILRDPRQDLPGYAQREVSGTRPSSATPVRGYAERRGPARPDQARSSRLWREAAAGLRWRKYTFNFIYPKYSVLSVAWRIGCCSWRVRRAQPGTAGR